VSLRPLVSVSGLMFGDYLLWNWSLNGNHDVIALVSGLTLPPLAVAFLWLLALSLARLLARTTRGGRRRVTTRPAARQASRPESSDEHAAAQGEGARASSRKIAA
jgi:hypothetical protein